MAGKAAKLKALKEAQAKEMEVDSESEEDSELDMDDDMRMGGYGPMSQVERKFFGAIVKLNEPCKVEVPPSPWRLVVMRASLGEEGAPDGTRVVLKAQVDEIKVVIGHFRGGAVESLALGG